MLLAWIRALYTDKRLLSFDVSYSFERSIWSLHGSVEFLVFWSSWWEESDTTKVLIAVCAARNSSQNKNIGAYSILSVEDDKEEMERCWMHMLYVLASNGHPLDTANCNILHHSSASVHCHNTPYVGFFCFFLLLKTSWDFRKYTSLEAQAVGIYMNNWMSLTCLSHVSHIW